MCQPSSWLRCLRIKYPERMWLESDSTNGGRTRREWHEGGSASQGWPILRGTALPEFNESQVLCFCLSILFHTHPFCPWIPQVPKSMSTGTPLCQALGLVLGTQINRTVSCSLVQERDSQGPWCTPGAHGVAVGALMAAWSSGLEWWLQESLPRR